MACTKTGGAHSRLKVRRWPKRFAQLLGVVAVVAVVGIWAGHAGTARAAVATRPLPTVPQPVPAVVPPVPAPSITTPAPPVTQPPVPQPPVTQPPVTQPPVTQPPVAPAVAVPTSVRPVVTVAPAAPDPCAVALAYLAAHAAPGFAHFCRPGPLNTAAGAATAYTCLPGSAVSCPDGVAEIIIAEPTCPASYENEASNSFWNLSQAGIVRPGSVQNGRTWDPFGSCP